MDEFYQQFKDNLENRPEPAFDPVAWEKLEKKIERAGTKTGSIFNWWWVAVPLLLLLLGSNFFLYRQLHENNEQISSILLQKDTVVQRQVIYQVDTIYQTRTIRESSPRSAFQQIGGINLPSIGPWEKNAKRDRFFDFNSYYTENTRPANLYSPQPMTLGDLRQQIDNSPFSSFSKAAFNREEEKRSQSIAQKTTPFSLHQLPNSAPPPLAYSMDWSVADYPFRMPEVKRHQGLRLGRYLLPTGLEVGGYIGAEILTEAKLEGLSFGLTGNLSFGDHLQLWFEAGRTQFKINSREAAGSFGIDEEIPSPLDDFTLKYIEAAPSYWQADIGLNYRFNTRHAWQPFLGAGFSSLQVQGYKAEYKFGSPFTQQELAVYEDINAGDRISYFSTQLGLHYQWHKRLALQLSGQYRYPVEQQNRLGSAGALALRLGIMYQL